ncbi:MAG: ribbon-helix-helix protein, CopG family [Acidothermaceae bacterium]
MSRKGKDYQRAAEWAEHDTTLAPTSTTARRGDAAATFGRDLLERSTGGRPSLDPSARPGQHSPVRQVRLPTEVNEQLAALARAENRSPSDVIRAALADYIASHTAS